MRYTTIIDISECREVWRCESAVKLYLYLVLKCGYHEHDRDKLRKSVRALAADVGLSDSACRHAINVLTRWQLLKHKDGWFWVRKYVAPAEIAKRPKGPKKNIQAIEARVRDELLQTRGIVREDEVRQRVMEILNE